MSEQGHDDKLKTVEKKIDVLTINVNKLISMNHEFHQRQKEIVIPSIKKLTDSIEGNGKPGLRSDITDNTTNLAILNVKVTGNKGLKKWVRTSVLSIILAIFTFIYGYGRLTAKVEHITKTIYLHVEKGK